MAKYAASGDTVLAAFYGITANSDDLKKSYELLVKWFIQNGHPPVKISVKSPGFSGKPISFKIGNQKLKRNGFSNVKYIEIFSLCSVHKNPLIDWTAISSISVSRQSYFTMCVRNFDSGINNTEFIELQNQIAIILNPHYGFNCEMDHKSGPQFYAIGLNHHRADEDESNTREEELAVSRWGDIGMEEGVYTNGIIRDVYPINYLSEFHLKTQIDEQTLHSWISSESSRGTLEAVNKRIFSWKVSPPKIPQVRERLWASGIIFNWRSYLSK
ncbi:MAG TPA: hypothetical protein VNQ76_05825 [Planctomicrobium sp.]|nr:hypothetical protein [Planctomicrobium sp.]